jgi:hypothetical protein
MTFDEFMEKMLAAFPQAMVETDNDGQLVIYTNLTEKDGQVVPVDDPNLIGL